MLQCLDTRNQNGCFNLTFLLAYCDDLFVITPEKQEYKENVCHLNKEAEIKEIGDATYHLRFKLKGWQMAHIC